jgi:hypothetical protein
VSGCGTMVKHLSRDLGLNPGSTDGHCEEIVEKRIISNFTSSRKVCQFYKEAMVV